MKNHTKFLKGKKALSLLLAMIMVFSVASPMSSMLGVTASAADDVLATIFTGSDFQDNYHGNSIGENLKKFVTNAQAAGFTDEPSAFLLGGDYTGSSYGDADSALTVSRMVENIHDIFPYYNTKNIVNVQGNHDVYTDDFNETGLYEYEQFLVYVINLKDYPASRGDGALATTQATADKLTKTFDRLMAEGETRPIFITTHLPMHFNSRNPNATNDDGSVGYNENHYGKILFDVINGYATIFDVVYLFGHNHSGNYDDYIGGSVNLLEPGDTIKLHNNAPGANNSVDATLNFTYMNYGYMGYSRNDVDSTLTMGAFEIRADEIRISRFSVDGQHGSTKNIERKLKTNTPSVTANGYNTGTVGSATGAIAVASGFTDPVFTWTSSNNNVARITANSRVAQIAYNQAGSATVTVTVRERNDSSKTATDSYTVTVGNRISGDGASIRLATQVVNGTTLEYYETYFGKTVALVGHYNLTGNVTATWTSSDTSVATVDNGVVTFKGTGTAFITYTPTNGTTTLPVSVKFVVSTEKKAEYIYKEVDKSTFSAGKKYVIATTRSGNHIHKDELGTYNQGQRLNGTATSFSGSSPNRTVGITDDAYVWNAIATGTAGVYYLQNEASGKYLVGVDSSYASDRGDFAFTTEVPSVTEGGWYFDKNGNLQNGKYHWYIRGSEVNLINTANTAYTVIFERTTATSSATIEYTGEVANGTTKTVYSATNGKQIALHGNYINIQECQSETWTSSNTSVATIDNNGVVTFKGVQGETTITYTVKDAIGGNTVSASFTLSAMLTSEVTRTFKLVKTIEAGKKYVVATKAEEVGNTLLLSSFRDTSSTLLAERSAIQVTSNGEYFVELDAGKNYSVWETVSDGSGHFYLKSERDGRFLYANGSYSEGIINTSEAIGDTVSDYQWTYSGKDLYNQSDNTDGTGNKVYLCARSAEFVGINTPNSAEFYFYEETTLSPNGVITSRYDILGETVERTEICPFQTEKLVAVAENFPNNQNVTFAWSVDSDDVATIDQNGVLTYTGKAGNVIVTLTTTSLEYDATGNKPVDTTTVKIVVNGGPKVVDPDAPVYVENAYYKTTTFEPGKEYVIHAVDTGYPSMNFALANESKSSYARLVSTQIDAPQTDSNGEYVVTTDESQIWLCEEGTGGYVYLKNKANGQFMFMSSDSASSSTGAALLVGVVSQKVHPSQGVLSNDEANNSFLIKYDSARNALVSKQISDKSTVFVLGNIAYSSSGGFYYAQIGKAGETGATFSIYGEPEKAVKPTVEKFELADDFVVGGKYILRATKTNESGSEISLAVSGTKNGTNKLNGTAVTPENNIISTSDKNIVWIVEASSHSNYYYLKNAETGEYLYINATGDVVSTTTEKSDLAALRFYLKDGTKPVIRNYSGALIRYESGFYESSSGALFELYAYTGSVEVEEDTSVITEIRKQDYFGSVDITRVMQYRYEVKNGDTEQILQYIVGLENGYTTTWSVSDTSIATIDQNGLLTYKGKTGYVDVVLTVSGVSEETGEAVSRTLKTTFDVSTEKYAISTEDYPGYPNEGAVRVNKTASNLIGTQNFQFTGVSEVELSVTGVPFEQPVDVVVVFDHSDSMGPEKLRSAIKNTRNFALQLFNANENNRIAVVTFDQYRYYYDSITATTLKYEAKNSEDRIVTGDGTIYNPFATADNKDALVQSLDELENNNAGGTNYDSGLNHAYRILKQAKASGGNNNQVVVFMSDGAPTKFNGLKLSGTSVEGSLDSAWLTGDESNAELAPYLADTATYPAAANFNPNGDNWYAAAIKTTEGQTVTGMPTTSLYEGYNTGLGAKIYTIGYAVKESSKEEVVLKNIATTPANYYSAADDLSEAYNSILDNILNAANDAVVTDKMGRNFDLQLDKSYIVKDTDGNNTVTLLKTPVIEVGAHALNNAGERVKDGYNAYETITFVTNSNGYLTEAYSSVYGNDVNIYDSATSTIVGKYVTYNLNTETFTWNIGDINRDEVVLKYFASLNGFKEGTAVPGVYETNEYATLDYINFRDTVCQQTFPVPTVAYKNAAINYEFYLVNVNGEPVNRQGQVVPFAERVLVGNEQVKQIYLSQTGDNDYTYALNAKEVVPSGYTLFNENAAFTISGNGGSVTGAVITDAGKSAVTTYYRDGNAVYKGTVPALDNYFNTHVSFGVVYKTGIVPDSVVVDFGLPVKINVLVNDLNVSSGTITAIGTAIQSDTVLNTDAYNSRRITDAANEITLANGTAKIVDGKVVYTPNAKANYNKEETFYYEYTTIEGTYYYTTVTVIPATSIYFEESFMTFKNSSIAKDGDTYNVWKDVGTSVGEVFQSEDRPGTFTFAEADANNVYGTDSAYDSSTTYSMGTAKHITVDKTPNATKAYPKAEFTFTGTGFDLFSVTDNTTGYVTATIYKAGTTEKVKAYAVSTYYGYTYDAENGYTAEAPKTDADGNPVSNAIFQVPVFRIRDLAYGSYDVVVEPKYSPAFDAQNVGSYGIYVDSVRIFDPMGDNNEVADDAYLADGEYAPDYLELRDTIIGKDNEGNLTIGTYGSGTLFYDGSLNNNVVNYAEVGPKNEVYLAKGQGIAFKVSATTALNLASLQVGMKLIGNKGNAEVTIMNTSQTAGTKITLTSATEQFFKLDSAIVWDQSKIEAPGQVSTYETYYPVIIQNTSSDEDVVISLTSLKWGYRDDIEGGASATTFNMFVDEGTPELAYAVMQNNMAPTTTVNDPVVNPLDKENVIVDFGDKPYTEGDSAKLTVTTEQEITRVTVNGTELTDCQIGEDGKKIWTYTFDAEQVGKNDFEIVVYDYEGTQGESIVEQTVILDKPEEAPEDNTQGGSTSNGGFDFTESFASNLVRRIFELIAQILSILGGGLI